LGVVVALVVFGIRFHDYFQRGATSAAARFDYWTVAGEIVQENPLRGSGPGSFEEQYRDKRKPDAEMTRLAHNDYLQQASDSGIPGALLFAAWLWGGLAYGYRLRRSGGLAWMVWLGLLGWALQEAAEFGLFIPGISWPAAVLLGWLTVTAHSDRQRNNSSLASEHP
jgi:O-antigen ligase